MQAPDTHFRDRRPNTDAASRNRRRGRCQHCGNYVHYADRSEEPFGARAVVLTIAVFTWMFFIRARERVFGMPAASDH